jgi:16S rRNA (cytosine1402-N4)-methyltransferase
VTIRGAFHVPVLVKESIEGLAVQPGGVYVDCTLGGGGHFAEIIRALGSTGTAIGIDKDPQSISGVKNQVASTPVNVIIEHDHFSALDVVLDRHGIRHADGILVDLGVSSHQIDDSRRGFSYLQDSPLDMRMNPLEGISAAHLLSSSSEEELARILESYGEIWNAGRMARAIKAFSRTHEIATSADIRLCLKQEYGSVKIKVLAKLFQALRIAVNNELAELEQCLVKALERLRRGGRLVVISYHSLEDRLVKSFMRTQERGCTCPQNAPICTCGNFVKLKRINRKAIRPSQEEISRNRRARSARLRIAEKTI